MLENKIDKIYICQQCKSAFLFHSDTEDHERLWDHDWFVTIPLEADVREYYKKQGRQEKN
jgi:hypothetical protein